MSRVKQYLTQLREWYARLEERVKPEHMEEKRTYLFETEDGEKYNPFSDLEEGANDEGDEWKYCPEDF